MEGISIEVRPGRKRKIEEIVVVDRWGGEIVYICGRDYWNQYFSLLSNIPSMSFMYYQKYLLWPKLFAFPYHDWPTKDKKVDSDFVIR